MKWSLAQEKAINLSGGTILVSAAAGSGKTAVLVERIISKIINKKNHVNIDELLVVTFSNASALEIKERVANKVNQLLLEHPEDLHLQTQQLLLTSADISTVHSFCQNVIRQNFQELSVALDFKIANQYQSDILQSQAFSQIIDEFYENPKFENLLKITNSTYNPDKLFVHIKKISEFLRAIPFFEDWVENQLNNYKNIFDSKNINSSEFSKLIFENSFQMLLQAKTILSQALKLSQDLENFESYSENLSPKLESLNSLLEYVQNNNWQKTFEHLHDLQIKALPRAKKNDDQDLVLKIKNLHNKFKDIIKALQTDFFFVDESDFLSDINYIYTNLKLLFEIINKFLGQYQKLKQTKKFLDFSDLEQLTLRLLYKKNNNKYIKSEIAKNLSKNYKEIFVDEYQDTNLAQEYIFRAISKDENNLFMVGDSKQSIYRFRQAMPQLFTQKINLYQDATPKSETQESETQNLINQNSKNFPAKILLNQNFRSNKFVTDFVNFVFRQLMSNELGEVEYSQEQELIPVLNNNLDNNNLTEICFLSCSDKNSDVNLAQEKLYYEALYIAKKIKNMVSSKFKIKKNSGSGSASISYSDVSFGDFCILMRSPNEKIKHFVKAFNELKIPIVAENSSNFFESKEICFVISLLKIINNPLDDINMLAVMFSEFFLFLPDDILKLKGYQMPSLFQAIKHEVGLQNNSKFQELYKIILEFKKYANILSLDKFLEQIYTQLDIYNIIKLNKNFESQIDNLELFKDIAKDFCDSGDNNLVDFIYYLNKLDEQKISFEINNNSLNSNLDAVKIMSIHKSKGLEFPICILADVGRQINKIDIKSSFLYHNELGIAMNRFDQEKNVRFSTLPKNALKLKTESNMLSEELRILYVALTRAKEKLIITIFDNNYQERISDWAELLSLQPNLNKLKISPYILKQAKNYEDFLILVLLRHPQILKTNNSISSNNISSKYFLENCPELKITCDSIKPQDLITQDLITQDLINQNLINQDLINQDLITQDLINQDFKNNLKQKINYKYPYQKSTQIPAKLGVSEISKQDLLSTANFQKIDSELKTVFQKKPKIFFKNNLSSAQLGNITHKFMQFADYKKAKENLNLECKRLLEQEFISEEEFKNLNKTQLSNFFDSELFDLIESSDKVHREFRFVYPLPRSELENIKLSNIYNKINNLNNFKKIYDDDIIVVQGIADCILEKQNNIIIIDYKTDRIKYLEELYDKYSLQLLIYQKALSQIFRKNSNQAIIYSFYLNKYYIIN